MIQPLVVIASFAILGLWLRSINGKHGFADELLTPVPLAFVGLIYEFNERIRNMKMIDVIGIILIVVGIAMTVLNVLAARQPFADVQSFTIQEIAPRGAGGNV